MYTPTKGFFDLSNQPRSLDSQSFKKLQKNQMELAHIQNNAEYFKHHHPQQWEMAKDLSGQMQQIIFQHWTEEELFI